jgi:hypothetical protein
MEEERQAGPRVEPRKQGNRMYLKRMRKTPTPTLPSSSLSLRAEGRSTKGGGKRAHAIALAHEAGGIHDI